jgi:broad specificity phosphatase PhoE
MRSSSFPADEPLDDFGRSALKYCSGVFQGAARYWTSPALRARQTAEALGFDADVEPALADQDHGRWAGCALEDIAAREPSALALWLSDPHARPNGGESVADVIGRVGAWLRTQAAGKGQVVAVTHAAVIRAAVVHAIGADPSAFWRLDIAPLTVARLSGREGRWNLQALGEALG